MTRDEFTRAYERLCRGHKFEATEERAEAAFRAIRHWSGHAWENAVDGLLLEPRMPSGDRLLGAVEAAADRLRRATPPTPYLPNRLPETAPNRDYGQARLELAKALYRGKITKRQAAEHLLLLADHWPHMAETLVQEATWFSERADQEALIAKPDPPLPEIIQSAAPQEPPEPPTAEDENAPPTDWPF